MSGTSTPRSGSMTPAVDGADGYLLLTVQHAVVQQSYDEQTMVLARGELRLECISLPIPPQIGRQTANPFSPSPSDPVIPTHDFWLVLHVGPTFEIPIIPEQYFKPLTDTTSGISYIVASPTVKNASLTVVLPKPTSEADMEDLESFEVLLRQYKSLEVEDTALAEVVVPSFGAGAGQSHPLPADMRGRIVLVNEDNGEVVGEFEQELEMEDDGGVSQDEKAKPVMLDFGNVVDGYTPKIKVQTVPEDELDDWMLKGAHNISQGILSVGSWSSRMISAGADKYVKTHKATDKPVHFSPRTKAGVRVAHNASVKTVNVTKTSVGMVNNAISKVIETGYEKGVQPMMDALDDSKARRSSQSSGRPPPPLPPRLVGTNAPPVPPRMDSPSAKAAPPVPGRKPESLKSPTSNVGQKIQLPSESETLLAQENDRATNPPANSENGSSMPRRGSQSGETSTPIGSSAANAKRPFFNRLLLAGEVVLTSIEATAHDLINTGTAAASQTAGHRFGPDAGHATALLGGSVRNVAVVYIDVRGVGRRALLKSSAKGFVKARLKNGEVVKLQGEGQEGGDVEVEAGEVEKDEDGGFVVGMPELGKGNQARSSGYQASSGKDGLSRRS